jgi:hypothetical protein
VISKGQELAQWVEAALSTSLDNIKWHEGEAWVDPVQVHTFADFMMATVDRSSIREELSAFEQNSSVMVPPERAAGLLKLLRQEPSAMSQRVALRVLSYDEALLRAEGARIWLGAPRSNDSEILSRILEDVDPRVLLSAYKGLVRSWDVLPEDRRQQILAGLALSAESPSVAVAFLPSLIVFDRIEYTGENPPWTVFARLLPVVLRTLPANARFTEARLFNSVEIAARHVGPQEIAEIGAGWIDWLEREVATRLPGDFELGVADILVTGTRNNPAARHLLIHRLLKFEPTGPLISFVKDLVDLWNDLTSDEQHSVTELLTKNRVDKMWLHAVAITREFVPREIQQLVLGDGNKLSSDPNVLVNEMPPDLLEASVAVYSGNPQPLWWLGTQTSGGKFSEIMGVLELSPDHPLFEAALWWALISPEDEHICNIVRNAGPTHAQRLFDYFLRYKTDCTGNWLPKTWHALLRMASDQEEKERWLDQMARNAPAILDDLTEARYWLTDQEDLISFLPRLAFDFEAEGLIIKVKDTAESDRFRKVAIERLRTMGLERQPRLHGTYTHILSALERYDRDFGSVEPTLRSVRESVIDECFKLREANREASALPLNWIS